MSDNVTGCVCTTPGFCSRHGVKKNPHFYHLCKTHAGYWQMWESCRGPGQTAIDCIKNSETRQSLPPEPTSQPPKKSCGCGKKDPTPEPVVEPIVQAEQPIELPSLWQQAKNLGSALVDHAANGFKSTPEDLQQSRLEICNSCPFLIKEQMRCGKCGCYVQAKSKMESSHCPIGKW